MIRFILSIFGSIFSTITLGIGVMALSIGAIFWVYGRDLPSHESLAQYQPPTISRIFSGEGQLIDEFAKERRLFTPSDEIPALVKQAFISAEDKNFYSHAGYDARGILAAGIEAVKSRGQNVRGASTITQQVMKNFLLSGDRRAERKIKEIILATRLEETLSKDKILELYLNEIFLGQNSYGVTAAAQTYFNKTLGELEPHEAATLASMPKAPSDYHPVREHERLLNRRNYVLREMKENGYISEAVYKVERDQPLRSVQNGDFDAFRTALPPRDYFTDEIRRQLSVDFGEGEFFTGGFTIRATIDEEMQTEAALAMRKGLEQFDRSTGVWQGPIAEIAPELLGEETSWREALSNSDASRDIITEDGAWLPAVVLKVEDNALTIGVESVEGTGTIPRSDIKWMRGNFFDNFKPGDVIHAMAIRDGDSVKHWSARQVPEVQGGFVAMDVNSGRVLAMQGGFSYQHSVFNRATQAQRQPGSSFKPFVYAAALDSGYSPATIVIDAPIEVNTPQGVWRPKNSNHKFYGPTPLRTGIEMSRNLMTIRLAQEVGMPVVAGYAERFGVYDNMGTFLANSLGAEETTLYKMVAAYAMFANGGERVEPTLVDRIQDRFGRTIYRHDDRDCVDCSYTELEQGIAPKIVTNREQVMDPITAYQLTSMLKGVVDRGTASSVINLPVPTAGKTGTTNDARDAWFVGFTSNIVAGCYFGYDNPRPMRGGRGYGGTLCGPVFQQFMQKATEKYGGGPFEVPPGGHFIKIDRYTGSRLPNEAGGANVVAEYFRDGEEPIFGLAFDGGFGMGSNLPLFEEVTESGRQVTTSSGGTAVLGPKATFGDVSSGGLY
ncbi:penicillin-binding protein 1A [Tritonibacter mobilis]|uniref:Penicillin-binding protein 1A n=1 Tax=Tritonibacter mobilis F1926 TaxID=1265309 RepID=A0A1B1A2V8_9RHOB|nr:PBP1A family penicillin-binding protein [Tritonibacter mobilis]ANP40914.1 penicillin-binding protein [Tritonibacter mobilis F1926]KJZ24236.1 penicillin-binding protein [Tritonibacter mobilis]